MTNMPAFQVVLAVSTTRPTDHPELAATAEVMLEAVQRSLPFIALGPVVSVDFDDASIEVECTVCAEAAEMHERAALITRVMLDAANAFEYQSGTTRRLDPVPV